MSRSTYAIKARKPQAGAKISDRAPERQIGPEEKLRFTQYTVDHFPETAIWTDLDANIIYVNDAACRILGYSREELLAMSVPDIDANYTLEMFAGFVASIKQRGSITLESRHVARDGRVIPVEISASYLKFDDGEYIVSFCRDISRRKRAEEALRESEERFRSLVENINDMVWEIDTSLTVTYASPKTGDILGYAPEEVVGRTPFDFICPADTPMVKAAIAQAIRDHRPLTLMEYRVRRKDGRVIWLETNGELITGPGGTMTGYRGINRDITERKGVEEALRKNEQFLSRIFNSFNDGISILDKDLNIVRVNRMIEEWYSYMKPLRGKKCYLAYHERSAPCEVCPSLRAIRLKTMQSDIVPLHGEHGELKGWLEIYSFPLLDDEGNVTGVIEHVRDITRRKQAEDALQESEERFRLYADMTPAILLIYQDNKYIYANRAAEEITGYSPDELYHKEPWFLMHPDYRDFIKERVLTRERGEEVPMEAEIKIVTKRGEEKWMAMNSRTITYKNRPAGIVVAFDITGMKETSLALEEAKARAELYLDLMSHDINNMNQIGIGYLELLFSSPRLEEPERELLEKSLESLEGSTRLIDNVQKLQKVSSGWLHREEVDVGQVLEQVKTYYTSVRGGSQIDYKPPARCKVMANELLYDVFSNLVGNAIKYSVEREGPRVSIRVSETAEAGKTYCRVAVEDSGPGIPDGLKDKIFDRLHRGSTKVGGKGLGLYLVKSLVQSYGGRAWVEDRVPGDYSKGSRFVVLLPAKE